MKEFAPYKSKRDGELNLEIQTVLSPYIELFMGERVLLSEIKEKVPHCLPALKLLLADGKVVGHHILDDPEDMLLHMPSMVKAKGEDKLPYTR